MKARAEGPREFLNLESLKCHFLDPAAPSHPRLLHTALGYTRTCTEWQIRITTRKSCSIFFPSVYSCTIFFLSSNCLPDIFFGILPTPPSKIKWSVPYIQRLYNANILLVTTCGTAGSPRQLKVQKVGQYQTVFFIFSKY